MPEYPNREQLEVDFAKKFGAVARRHMREFRKLLGDPPDIKNVPESFWEKVEDDADREFFPIFLILFEESFDIHGWTGGESRLAAYGMAVGASQNFGKYWSKSTRSVIEQKFDKLKPPDPGDRGFQTDETVDEHRERTRLNPRQRGESPDVPPGNMARAPRVAGPNQEPPRDVPEPAENRRQIPQVEEQQSVETIEPESEPIVSQEELDRICDEAFNPHRIDRMVSDETTRCRFAGGEIAIENTVGISQDDLWICDFVNSNVCKICAPNHMTTRREWGPRFPNGAPIHPRCACLIRYANQP